MAGEHDQLRAWLPVYEHHGCARSLTTYNTAILSALQQGRVAEARSHLARLAREPLLRPNEETSRFLVFGLVKSGADKEALVAYEDLRAMLWRPKKSFFGDLAQLAAYMSEEVGVSAQQRGWWER
jgi:hypothetical protein